MKPCDVTKFIKFYLARDSANRPKMGRNCARLTSFQVVLLYETFKKPHAPIFIRRHGHIKKTKQKQNKHASFLPNFHRLGYLNELTKNPDTTFFSNSYRPEYKKLQKNQPFIYFQFSQVWIHETLFFKLKLGPPPQIFRP